MYDFLDTVCPECGVEFKKIRIRFEDGSEKYQQAECPVCFKWKDPNKSNVSSDEVAKCDPIFLRG